MTFAEIEIWNLVITGLGVIATIILTILIIIQSGKLGKKQTELQKRQIKIDERPYLEKLHKHLYELFGFAEAIKAQIEQFDGSEKNVLKGNDKLSGNEAIVYSIHDFCKKIMSKTLNAEVDFNLLITKNYVSNEVAKSIEELRETINKTNNIIVNFTVSTIQNLETGRSDKYIIGGAEKVNDLKALCEKIMAFYKTIGSEIEKHST